MIPNLFSDIFLIQNIFLGYEPEDCIGSVFDFVEG